jgi:RNA polymerase sigma factor (sigma-70 family)
MNWETFVEVYDKQLHGMARSYLRRWKTPIAVGEEDVVQELRLGAWLALNRYEPDRGGMTPAAYAMIGARTHAQGWIHGQRNAVRRHGTSPSRFPMAESGLGYELERATASRQEAAVEFSQRLHIALAGCVDSQEREVFAVLLDEGFDIDAASGRLVDTCGSAKHARAQVRSAVQRMERV